MVILSTVWKIVEFSTSKTLYQLISSIPFYNHQCGRNKEFTPTSKYLSSNDACLCVNYAIQLWTSIFTLTLSDCGIS